MILSGLDERMNIFSYFNSLIRLLEIPYQNANCSVEYTKQAEVGSLINGSYDGVIENLTREIRHGY